MPRRNRIPLKHRERIVRAFDDEEEDYLLVVDTLGVNRSTARGIVARYIREGRIREGPRGGRNNVRVDDEMRDCLEEIINENCLLTLANVRFLALMNASSRYWSSIHTNECVFSRNEQQKVYIRYSTGAIIVLCL